MENAPEHLQSYRKGPTKMIDLVNVRKSFGDLEVLKDINIHIDEKEIYGIIEPYVVSL